MSGKAAPICPGIDRAHVPHASILPFSRASSRVMDVTRSPDGSVGFVGREAFHPYTGPAQYAYPQRVYDCSRLPRATD